MNGLPVAGTEPELEVEVAVVPALPDDAVVLELDLLLLPQAATAVKARAAVPETSR